MNQFGEVYNSPETFDALAEGLRTSKAVCVHWTDGAGTLYNVLFAYPEWAGGAGDSYPLCVAVLGRGSYTFDFAPAEAGYVAQKLGVPGAEAEQLRELIAETLARRTRTTAIKPRSV